MSESRLLFSIFIIITESFQVCENSGLHVDASESTCYFYKIFLLGLKITVFFQHVPTLNFTTDLRNASGWETIKL